MGMSASQARLLSLTARMHDMEFEAQGIQYAKLNLVDLKDAVYDEYMDALDSTKMQMSVLTANGKVYQDITYTNMLMSQVNGIHSMYLLANGKGEILLPEQVANKLGVTSTSSGNNGEFLRGAVPDNLDEFLKIVAKNYLYTGRVDLSDDQLITQMQKDGNYDYWKSIFYQLSGYQDDEGNIISGRGFCPISQENASDREWLEKALNSGEVQLYKMSTDVSLFNSDKINIFAESNVATDTDLQEVSNTELIQQATVKYEKAIKDLDAKETKFDLQLAKIDQDHNALKTEYDAVKQIVSKSIDRSFKSFNA